MEAAVGRAVESDAIPVLENIEKVSFEILLIVTI